MKRRTIGTEQRQISALGVGAMSFSNFYGAAVDAESLAVLAEARALGVTHIDTANIYGPKRSEAVIGQYLAKEGVAARAEFHIATKAAITKDADGNRCFDNSLQHLEAELDQSLERLGTDHVDLFYVHRRDPSVPIEEVAGHLAALVKKGKTRGIGFSEIAPSSLRRASSECHVDAVQSEYSLSTRAPELGLLQACEDLGTAFVAFSPLGRSLLTDHPLTAEVIATKSHLANFPRLVSPNYEANMALLQPFRAYAADLGETTAALAIAWTLAKSPACIAIPGTRSVAHFRESVRGATIDLTQDQMKEIERILPVGWAHGDRYSPTQWVGPERYC